MIEKKLKCPCCKKISIKKIQQNCCGFGKYICTNCSYRGFAHDFIAIHNRARCPQTKT